MEFKSSDSEYTSVPITKLYFDNKVVDMVKINGGIFPEILIGNILTLNTFKLNQERLNSVFSVYETGLPPITVQKTNDGRIIVMNGRHRVCATILKGCESVPVCFV